VGGQVATYDPDNLLDRVSRAATLELQYRQVERRERAILSSRLGLVGGRVLSVGCGWHPGRHLFPAPAFELVGVDVDPAKVAAVRAGGSVDEAHVGRAGSIALPERSFDVVLYRQVLHHVAHGNALAPCFEEAARLLAPGGAMVAVEPGLWHPVGAVLTAANRLGLAPAIHGTPDDVPLSPRRLREEALAAGLQPELHAVTYTWRRMPPPLQRALWKVDRLGSRPRLGPFGHTLMLIARNSASR
jgi:SAM-dependent methyltransferase